MARRNLGQGPTSDGSRRVLGLLVLAALTVITLDARTGDDSPLNPVRSAVGSVVGPVENATATVTRPISDLADYFTTNKSLRDDVATLSADNARLRNEVSTEPLDRKRLAELDSLTRTASETGYSLVAARVIALGPVQSFSRTVTIDAGTSAGLTKNMTVLNNDGLVGRVVQVTRSTATVLLIVDTESVVGGRLGTNSEIGFLRGRGTIGGAGRLDLELVDNAVAPSRDDVVVTWGSDNGVPYVAGIPIGKVESVVSSPRQSSRVAVIAPFVDFTALDVVGVVVPKGTQGDRTVITQGGSR
ncbi:rod shape-determining protein MreC [Marmoricola sp. OAE513]|uniref:rod shape-determining protein MreC n=1 Tax=Marmoricola sp. OAE513 TaxID=2817894 RepID=UPI001AE799F2